MEYFIRDVDFSASASDGLTLEGYAAVFDSPTVINSFAEGHFVEVIERGAFAKTVRNNPKPVMQFDHGTHPNFGSMPIGVIEELREDDQGLFVRATLHSGDFFEPVREAIASGSMPGMSFKFTIPEGGQTTTRDDENLEVHTLTELNLHELGPVVWPAYKETSGAVRHLTDLLSKDDELRRAVFADLVFGVSRPDFIPADKLTQDLAVRSDTDEPTVEDEEPTDESPSVSDSDTVRSDPDPEPTADDEAPGPVNPARTAHQRRLAEIMAARAERALRHFENKEIENGKRVNPKTSG
jgi:HK97 family phage prohead protease